MADRHEDAPLSINEPAEAMQYWYHQLRDELRAGGSDEIMVLFSVMAAEVRGLARLLVAKGIVAPADWQRATAEAFEQEYTELVNHTGRYAPDDATVPTAERGDDDNEN